MSESGNNIMRLWDTATSASLQTPEGDSDDVNPLAFSLDGEVVLTMLLWGAVFF